MNNIEILEEFIKHYKEVQEKYKDDEIQAEIERSCYFEEVPAEAIENLIQENKELQKYKTYYEEMEEVNKKFIPKSKIKEKIKEYNIPIFDVLDKLPIPRTIERGCGAKDGIIYVLQELLEGE